MPKTIRIRRVVATRTLLAVLFSAACLWILFFGASATHAVRADELNRSGESEQYLTRFKKWLAKFEETDLQFKALTTRSEADEVCGKSESSGHLRVSALHRSLHSTQTGMSNWARDLGEIAEDHGTTEVLLDGKSLLQLITRNYIELSPEPLVDVKVTQPVAAGDWSKVLADHELGLLFGYLPSPIQVKGLPNSRSLMALCQRASCDVMEKNGDNNEKLLELQAKAREYELRILIDPSNDQLRQLEFVRPEDHVEPFGLRRAVLRILEMRRERDSPSSMTLTTVREYAPGESKPASGSQIEGRKPAKKSVRVEFPSQTYETTFEIQAIGRDVRPPKGWASLENAIPNGTMVELNGSFGTHYWQDGKVRRGVPPRQEKTRAEKRGSGSTSGAIE